MEVLEHRLCGKHADASRCEDGFVVTDDFAAVIDGSTSKIAGRNAGRRAMEIICNALKNMPADIDKHTLLQHLTAALAAENPPEARENAAYRLTCSAVIVSAKRREAWMIGDCQLRFNSKTYTNQKLTDSILTQARCDMLHYLIEKGHITEDLRQNDLGRAFIFDALRDQTNFQNDCDINNPFRYTVLDGTPIDVASVRTIALPSRSTDIILASDGYPKLFDSLARTETYLSELLRIDPLCIKENPATKGLVPGQISFDDRCFLKIRL